MALFKVFTKSAVDLTSSGFPVGKNIDDGVGRTTMSVTPQRVLKSMRSDHSTTNQIKSLHREALSVVAREKLLIVNNNIGQDRSNELWRDSSC